MARRKYTNEQLLLDYLNASNLIGRWLKSQEIGPKAGLAYFQTYLRRFGNIINIRKSVIRNFYSLIKFPSEVNIPRKRTADEEILNSIIIQSITVGYKLERRDIDADSCLPSPTTIINRFGTIEHMHLLASEISEDFAKLPYYAEARKSSAMNRYIEICLKQSQIISVLKLSPSNIGCSYRYIYKYFENIENFRSECAKASSEFAESLAQHNQK